MSYKTNITPSESQQNRVKMRQNTVNTEVWGVLPDFYILTKMVDYGVFGRNCFTIVLLGGIMGKTQNIEL